MKKSFFANLKNILLFISITFSVFLFNNCDHTGVTAPEYVYEGYKVVFDSLYHIGNFGSAASDIIEVSSGGYIIAGTFAYNGHTAFLMQLDNNGKTLWSKYNFNGDRLNVVIETSDNGFAAAGRYIGGGYVVRTGQSGSVLWEQFIEFQYATDARKIFQASNSDLIVPVNSYEIYGKARLARLSDINGSFKWTIIIEGSSDSRTLIYNVSEEANGNLKVLGITKTDTSSAGWIITLDPDGNELSRKDIKEDISDLGSTSHGSSIIPTANGGFAGVNLEYFYLFDNSGELIRKQIITVPSGYYSLRLNSVVQNNDGSFIAAGFQTILVQNDSTHVYETETHGGLFLLSAQGLLIKNVLIDDEGEFSTIASVILSRDNNVVVTGYFVPTCSEDSYCWVKKVRLL